jgi:dihydrolipoamide dehydrogenase
MSVSTFDVVIVGGGPAGYLAAERAGATGRSVLLIEKDQLGGVCLNWGCIPTKTLLHSAKLYQQAKNSETFGLITENPRYDFSRAMAWKDKVVETLRGGVETMMRRHHVEVIRGEGVVRDRSTVGVDGDSYRARTLLIATGSSPIRLPVPGSDSPNVLTSTEMLALDRLPESLVVVGGGVIGMEFACLFRMLGVKVTVIELLPEILPNLDPDIGALLRKTLPDVSFHLGCRVESLENGQVTFSKDGKQESVKSDLVLMSVGRRPNTEDIGLDRLGLDYDGTGIRVDDSMRTNVPLIYAIGDVNGRSLLAHSAYRMAEVAVAHIVGTRAHMRYRAVPWVVYTHPEIASVGLTEGEIDSYEGDVAVARVPLRISGRYYAEHGDEPGICKVIVDKKTKVLLGVQIVGGPASEIIYGASAMIEAELRVQDIREIVFPHPTVSEIIKDAVWSLKV